MLFMYIQNVAEGIVIYGQYFENSGSHKGVIFSERRKCVDMSEAVTERVLGMHRGTYKVCSSNRCR